MAGPRWCRGVVPVVVLVVGSLGCPPEDPDDDTPPRVLAVEPASPVVAVTATFEVTFSEPINPATVVTDPSLENLSVLIVDRELATESFLDDVENGGAFLDSREDDIEPVNVATIRSDEALSVAPIVPLLPLRAYRLIISGELRDTAGNPLVDATGVKASFIWDFTTDAGAPAVADTDLPSAGSFVVPNRKRFSVTFNQPVQNVTNETLSITGPTAPIVDAILLDEARTTATILLGAGAGCERLQPSSTYTLAASNAIIADNGQALQPFTADFQTGPACDTNANTIIDVTTAPREVDASITFTTSKPSSTELRYGVQGGDLDCLGAPCPVAGPFVSSAAGGVFVHTVAIDGLSVGVTYAFVAIAEDEVGFVARREGTLTTVVLPKVSINEYLAVPTTPEEPAGEFVELASYETTISHDLSGWQLIKLNSSGNPVTCTLPAGSVLPAGGFLLVTANAFDAATAGVDDAIVKRVGASLCGNLLNTSAARLELRDTDARTISTANPTDGLTPDEGVSVERTSPEAPDGEASFCENPQSTSTPGAPNGAFLSGCG